jgi:predicted nucleic acid-binding protein
MSGKSIILDTNILLYFLDGDKNTFRFLENYDPVISFVTELELLSAPEISPGEKLFIKELLKDLTIIKYSDQHKEDIIKIRAKKKLKLPDAIIVSLAITLGIPLVTADKALKNIEGLDIIFYEMPANE